MITENVQTENDVWKSDAERLAFGLFMSKPRADIVVVDLVNEAFHLDLSHDTLYQGFASLNERGFLGVLFGGRHAHKVAISELDAEDFEHKYGAKDVHAALGAYLARIEGQRAAA